MRGRPGPGGNGTRAFPRACALPVGHRGAAVHSGLHLPAVPVAALRLSLALACATVLAGCFTFRSTVAVSADGSGTVTETLALSGPARRMMRSGDAPLSTAEALLARAAGLGEGVALVRTDTTGGVRTTVYAFRDVARLRYRLPDNASEPADIASTAGVPPLVTFAFEPATGDAPATLRISMPAPADTVRPVPDSAAVAQAVQGLALARVLLGDARATVQVVAVGERVADAQARADSSATTTLLDLDFGPLFDLIEENPELATFSAPPLAEVRRLAAGRSGLTVLAPGTVTVRFR